MPRLVRVNSLRCFLSSNASAHDVLHAIIPERLRALCFECNTLASTCLLSVIRGNRERGRPGRSLALPTSRHLRLLRGHDNDRVVTLCYDHTVYTHGQRAIH